MLLQNPPPSLDDEKNGNKHFTRELHDLVALCLQKDPMKRPSSFALLDHKFFKRHTHSRDPTFLKRTLLHDLPDVVTRVQHMRDGIAGAGRPTTAAG